MTADDTPKDPDFYIGAFDPIELEITTDDANSALILAVVKEHGALYFVIRKRYPAWTVDAHLDAVRLSDAVKRLHGDVLPCSRSFKDEILRVAFENFIQSSPFTSYIRKSINQWDAAQFFSRLRTLTPALHFTQLRRKSDEQATGNYRVPEAG